ACISRHQLPWCVTQVGARCEFQFGATPPTNGTQAEAMFDAELEHLIHLALLNRGVLITPFHNMLLCSPATSRADVAQLLQAFDEVLAQLSAAGAYSANGQRLIGPHQWTRQNHPTNFDD
ncbi:MAG TPA: hypothetical protein VIM63_06735, partial [Rhodoferax sp.]